MHHLSLLTYKGKLCLCPKIEGAKRVLDMGTGTGMWAIDYGITLPGQYSSSETVRENAKCCVQPICTPGQRSLE